MIDTVAYTIGMAVSYDRALAEHPPVIKVGRGQDYPGGAVFRTSGEAAAYLRSPHFATIDWGDGKSRDPRDFRVYRMILNNTWESATHRLSDEPFDRLLYDAVVTGRHDAADDFDDALRRLAQSYKDWAENDSIAPGDPIGVVIEVEFPGKRRFSHRIPVNRG